MIAKFDNNGFLSRLEILLGSRYERGKHPWGTRIGLSAGMTQRLFAGQLPGPDYLQAIQLSENVSLDWLIAGFGSPFRVETYDDPGALSRAIRDALGPEPADAGITVVHDTFRRAVVLDSPDTYRVKEDGGLISYRAVAVFTGPITAEVLGALDALPTAKHWCSISPDAMQDLAAGRLGTWALFGDDDQPGLIAGRERVASLLASGAAEMAEPAPGYGAALTPAETALVADYRTMPDCERSVFERIARTLRRRDEQDD